MLSRLVITFLPRSKRLLISWLQSPSAVILEPKNKVWHCFHCFPIYFPWSDGTGCRDLSFLNVELYTHTHISLCFGFPPHLGHHRGLRRASRATQGTVRLLISYLFHTQHQKRFYVSSNLPIHPTFLLPFLVHTHLFSASMSLFLFCK